MRPFMLVFVCTGNRFRSALAEAFVCHLTVGLPVRTESFGTLELDCAPALPEAVELAQAVGVNLAAHRTRCVTGASLAEADLVLGFDEQHVRHAVVEGEAARTRSFTCRHFVRLLESVSPPQGVDVVEGARTVVAQAAALRDGTPATAADDMLDPLGASRKVQRETAAEIRELSIALTSALFGVSGEGLLPPVPSKVRRRPLVWRR